LKTEVLTAAARVIPRRNVDLRSLESLSLVGASEHFETAPGLWVPLAGSFRHCALAGVFFRVGAAKLQHEIFDDAMEVEAVVKSVLHKIDEIGHRVGHLVEVELRAELQKVSWFRGNVVLFAVRDNILTELDLKRHSRVLVLHRLF